MEQNKLSDDELNRWRTLVALAHVDGEASKSEREFIVESIKKRNVDASQVQIILGDLEKPQDPAEFFDKIKSPRDRGLLFYTARVMFYNDGTFSEYEKMYYDKFKAKHMKTVDMGGIMQEIATIQGELPSLESSSGDTGAFSQFRSILDRYF